MDRRGQREAQRGMCSVRLIWRRGAMKGGRGVAGPGRRGGGGGGGDGGDGEL